LELDLKGDGRPIQAIIKDKQAQMKMASQNLEFEVAALLRDELRELYRKNKPEKPQKT